MGLIFKGLHPIFGRAGKTLSKSFTERSPYYWWWEFLRRNENYRACCASGGTGDLSELYKKFGDVVSNDNFKTWWSERGYYLFAEHPKPVKLSELSNPSEWDSSWTRDSVMVVAVPLDIPKRKLQGFFASLLKDRHSGKRGRKKLSDSDASTARFPLFRSVSIHTLRIQLAVFDAVTAKKRGEHDKTLARIGTEMKLVPKAMPSSNDDKNTAEHKRNVMASTVSRHYKDACRIVANTAIGQFPNSQ
jgi:hypothetical protein